MTPKTGNASDIKDRDGSMNIRDCEIRLWNETETGARARVRSGTATAARSKTGLEISAIVDHADKSRSVKETGVEVEIWMWNATATKFESVIAIGGKSSENRNATQR